MTTAGAYAGRVTGMFTFIILHSGALEPGWFGPLGGMVAWLVAEAPNPFSCAAMGEGVSVFVTWAVSMRTQPLAEAHVELIFGSES